ncbi:MAG TPA: hypothetical protein VF275_03495 [Gammaproteobacteria bacterium]
MEDIRKLLNDDEAEIAPESLAYILRGLNAAIADQLTDSEPDAPSERRRYLEINGALTRSAELYSAALVRWMCRHVDECLMRNDD